MANREHLDILQQGIAIWNTWREEQGSNFRPDLSDTDFSLDDFRSANLRYADLNAAVLNGADLRYANLGDANLTETELNFARLDGANLSNTSLFNTFLGEANLRGADLRDADLRDADLRNSILTEANLFGADLSRATLNGADLSRANVGWTTFGDLDLRTVRGLETLNHEAPSTIGTDTILRSQGDIPEAFLKSAGVDDTFITYIRSLIGKPIDYYTCFISYSSKDQDFAERLYADLQSRGVRCWYAPEDMKIGDKIRHRIEESIRLYDKLLLILSEDSIASNWVAYEVEKALDKEPKGIPNVLYPVRLDDRILTCTTEWATNVKSTRHIGDFTHWKNHDDYQKTFNRLLRALKAGTQKREP